MSENTRLVGLRMPIAVYDQLMAAAEAEHRSLSGEILHRLALAQMTATADGQSRQTATAAHAGQPQVAAGAGGPVSARR